MRTRIHDVPACFVETVDVSAKRYNLIQLALNRLDGPLRFPLIGLRNLDILLDRDVWACVDRSVLDLPVAAWNQFDTHDRIDLQADVRCELRHYQVNTDILLPYMWMTLESILRGRLTKEQPRKMGQVINLFPQGNP